MDHLSKAILQAVGAIEKKVFPTSAESDEWQWWAFGTIRRLSEQCSHEWHHPPC
jgi:hypothetical protein